MAKILKSFAVFNIGGDRVSYRYDEADEKGKPVSVNNEGNIYAIDPKLKSHIDAIRDYIRINELEG